MVSDNSRKNLPPYVSYRTFCNFLGELQKQMPARIDRSYWDGMFSGSVGTQLVAALHFLGLVDANARPAARLKALAPATGEDRARLLREILMERYSFVLNGPLEVQNATYAQVTELFDNSYKLAVDVRRKCIKFFICIAGDAGVPLSSFITRKSRGIRGSSNSKSSTKKPTSRTNRNGQIPLLQMPNNPQYSWNEALLNKFPGLDPAWNDDLKTKWFDAFGELMRRLPPGNG